MDRALQLLNSTWELSLAEGVTEAELLARLSAKVRTLLAEDPERFYGIMYRLDIDERKMIEAVHDRDGPVALARLIFQRQWQKAASRAVHRKKPDEDSDLSW